MGEDGVHAAEATRSWKQSEFGQGEGEEVANSPGNRAW